MVIINSCLCILVYLKDEFKKAVSTIDRLYMDQKELVVDIQTKLQEKEKESSTMKIKLEENKNEISAMKVKLDEKDAAKREFKLNCDRSIHQLNDQLSTKVTEIENLRRQLKEMEDTCKNDKQSSTMKTLCMYALHKTIKFST